MVMGAQVIAMVLALGLLAGHVLKWSGLQVDAVTLGLLGLIIVIPFSNLITHIKWGDFEADIGRDEVAKAQAKVASELTPPDVSSTVEDPESRMRELLKEDPQLAIARVRIDLEQSLKRLYLACEEPGTDPRHLSLVRMVDSLLRAKVLSAPIAGALRDVIGLANRAVHGDSVERDTAEDLALLGVRLVEELQIIYRDRVLAPIERTEISVNERDQFASARYRVTTVVPLVDGPYRNVYVIDQEAFDTLLEGYEVYAEFIVGVERIDGEQAGKMPESTGMPGSSPSD